MNLQAIASRAVGAVNPNVTGTLQISTGYTTDADGTRQPNYAAPVTVTIQAQALSTKDLAYLSGLAVQGSTRKLYLNGQIDGIARYSNKGGDLVTIGTDRYLVTAVLENWPASNWCAVAVTRQL